MLNFKYFRRGALDDRVQRAAQTKHQMADRHRRLRVLASAKPGLLDRTSVLRARHESSSHRAFDSIQPWTKRAIVATVPETSKT